MDAKNYFSKINSVKQKQYEALKMYYTENKTAKDVAAIFGYKHRGFTTIIEDFSKALKNNEEGDYFFREIKKGRKVSARISALKDTIIKLRKKYYSVQEIKGILDATGSVIGEVTIYNTIKDAGFAKLPRRTKQAKKELELPKIKAPVSQGKLILFPHLFVSYFY